MNELEIPQTWTQTTLGKIAQVDSGIGFPNEYQGITSGDLPFFKVGDVSNAVLNNKGRLTVGKHYVSREVANILRGKPLKPGSTVFAKIGEAIRLNRRGYVTTDCLIDNNVMAVKAVLDESDRYIHYFLRTVQFTDVLRATTVPSLRKGDVEELQVPLAPLPEQKRIADKLDSALARVDACRDRLDRLPALLKRFRQSILAAATSGALTTDWRAPFPTTTLSGKITSLPQSWREVTFSEVCHEITVGYVGKMADQYQADGIPFLRSMNIRAFRFDRKGLLHISPEFHKQVAKSTLRPGDMAIVRSGAPGVCCVIPDELQEANCSDLVIARPTPELLPQYGCIFMNSTFAADFVNANKVGVAQAHFNVGSMKITPLPLPPLPEQTEIVRRVQLLFAFADRLEARLAAARRQIGQLTPALLAKAFRGELVPQDPADEPAAELLKRLAAQREAAPKARRGRASKA